MYVMSNERNAENRWSVKKRFEKLDRRRKKDQDNTGHEHHLNHMSNKQIESNCTRMVESQPRRITSSCRIFMCMHDRVKNMCPEFMRVQRANRVSNHNVECENKAIGWC